MRQFFRFLTCLGLLLIPVALTSAGTRELSAPKRVSMVPGELIIAFKPSHSAASLSMNGQSLMKTARLLGTSRRGTAGWAEGEPTATRCAAAPTPTLATPKQWAQAAPPGPDRWQPAATVRHGEAAACDDR